MEQKILNEVQIHHSYWARQSRHGVGPVASIKKNIHGVVITKYRSVKVLCEYHDYKVIHNFALYEKSADGSIQLDLVGRMATRRLDL